MYRRIGRLSDSHLVLIATSRRTIDVLNIKLVLQLDVQISLVLVIRRIFDHALDDLAFLHSDDFPQVEHSLLPVRVLSMRACREANRLVACGEVDVEPRDEGVDEVGTLAAELVGHLEGEVGGCDGIEIESDKRAGVSDKGLHLDGVDERLRKSGLLHGRIVEAVNVVPDCLRMSALALVSFRREKQLTSNLVILVIAILNTSKVHRRLIWEDLSVRRQVSIARIQDGVQHALIQQEVTHPLGNDDINLVKRQFDLLHLALEQGDLVSHAVHGDDLLGLLDDRGHVDADDVLGASAASEPILTVSDTSSSNVIQRIVCSCRAFPRLIRRPPSRQYIHAENTSSTSNIENNLILEDVTVLVDRIAIRASADIIFLRERKNQKSARPFRE